MATGVDLFGAIGGRPTLNIQTPNEAIATGSLFGKQGAEGSTLGLISKADTARKAEQVRGLEVGKLKREERVGKILEKMRTGLMSENKLEQEEAKAIYSAIKSNPAIAQSLGLEPDKFDTGSGYQETVDFVNSITGGGGNIPPGTTLSKKTSLGNLNIPLNNKLTGTDANVLAGSKQIIEAVKQIKGNLGFINEQNIIKGAGPFLKKKQAFDQTKKYIISTLLAIKSGAAVSDQEMERWTQLLSPSLSNSKEVDAQNLDRFISEFSDKINLQLGGSNYLSNNSDQLTEDGEISKILTGLGY